MKIYMPWKNLGCLGFKIGRVYFDIYKSPCWGIFVNTGKAKYTIHLPQLKIRKWR